MKCEDVVRFLRDPEESLSLEHGEEVSAHVEACETCRDELRAVRALRAERSAPVGAPDPLLLSRSVHTAVQQAMVPSRSGRRGFLLGTLVGGALAAALAIAVVYVRGVETGSPAQALPEIRLAVNETRDVSIALDSPRALAHAQVHVLLSGAIGLEGFDGQKELSWYTDLDAGVNRLTLPVTVLGAGGGQLVVEVEHENRRRTFVLDVRSV